jgi:tetratricopeptide (TPR) repeat protein
MKDNSKSKIPFFVIGFLLLGILILSYSNHFNNTFHFDDSHTIESNPYIKSLDNCWAFFYSPQMFSSLPSHWGLRPLVSVSLAIDYWMGNSLNPFYFQLSTFIWYILLCIILYFIYQKIISQSIEFKWTAFSALFITGWYALHTANAETINYIISRSDVLSTFFILASFSLFIHYPNKRKWYLYIIPAVLGVFTKETVLTLVIILFFYINLFEKNISIADHFKKKQFQPILKTIITLLPLFICVAAVQFYTLSFAHSTKDISNPLGYYILTQPYVWVRYFIAFFIPANLTADSDWGVIMNVFDERIIIGLIFIIGLIYTIFKTSVKQETKPIAFGLIWFSVTLLPTSIAPFAEVTNDHRMFFPFIGLALAVGQSINLLFIELSNKKTNQKLIQLGFILSIICILSLNAYGVYQRNKIWKTEESLWQDVTIKSPANGRGLMNYGLALMARGDYANANIYFQKALIYNPYYDVLYTNIAILKAATLQPAEAELNFKKAIEFNKESSQSPYLFYAAFLKNNKRYSEAEAIGLTAQKINSYNTEPLELLALIYSETAQWDKLTATANKILAIDPSSEKGKTFLKTGQERKPIEINNTPTKSVADLINKSLLLYNEKQYQKCIEVCNEVLTIDPNNADAYNNIGAAYNGLKEWQKAIDACTKALQLNPNHKLANGNLNWAKSELKKQ